ncbi:ferredoxin [Streptomyces sp. NPDC059506]|uniref:ferredoxin n=1 Tax=Streptomyces TaxID=1883 RepID=UPI000CB473BF|nr:MULTISPECIES: ferredoxin [unclassified Streptomyces]MCZ2523224.1 ferredoxin [Streptomyces sp. HB2AG]PLW66383.1 ferredoxin [Streptomyces sp. DJ]QMV23412.1 ferredoxin [Streptomyces sp. SCUT-3]
MRIHVDMNRCESHGQCVFAAPDHFSFDEDDVLLVQADVPDDEAVRAAVREAATACPVQAITLQQDGEAA